MIPPAPSCVLVRDQLLDLGEEGKLSIHRTELTRPDLVSFTLLVEVSGSPEVVNLLLQNPDFLRGSKVACCYEGVEATAQLEIWTTHEFTFPSGRSIFHFACSTIASPQTEGEHFEFLLPFVDFGQGDQCTRIDYPNGGIWQPFDRLSFEIDGHVWTLRNLYEIDHVFYTAEEAAARQKENPALSQLRLKPSAHSLLQVPSSIGADDAEAVATKICWLLHLAFAQPVAWAEMRIRRGSESRFQCRRSFAFPQKVAATKPLRNWVDGTLKTYLEAAYPKFQEAESWWAETLNWYSIATEHVALESSSMIFCMLFDRISTRLLKGYKFPKQIGTDLETLLKQKENREGLEAALGEVMKARSEGWDDFRSGKLVDQIKLWNDSPSYPKKIAIAFSLVGLKQPGNELLGHRHKLMHEGGLNLKGQEAVKFLLDLNEQILALLFAMLDYRAHFFLMGRGKTHMAAFALEDSGGHGDADS